ncbi:hypothetical protein [Phyllobacterium sp. UNC302MFCol5.2]|uniref:hypothetical protein n=1 Tax=Phyllobacterium sp. UNC302MFCol5.2 TaxID=1449065 RepID=UPI0012DE6796|nr:hypothetical protein [Phyllobacterium sp. UNC302MFCol5.2]
MSSEPGEKVTVNQKNDDGLWYYAITAEGKQGPKVGPFDTEEAALAAGEDRLAKGESA